MVADSELSSLAPRLQARISAWEKRAQLQRDRLSAFLARQPANVAQSTRQQLVTQRLQQRVNARREWVSALKTHYDALYALLTSGGEGSGFSTAPSAVSRRKSASAGE